MTSSAFLKLSGNVRIGELLVQSGKLTKQQLLDATHHAGARRLQIGQILVMYGYLTAIELQSALAAQSMVRDRSIDMNKAVQMLKVAYKTGSRFEDVLRSEQFPTKKFHTGKLGELLLDAGLISSEHFLKAMDNSFTTGLPLGRTLVLDQVLTDQLLKEALDIQVRLRDEMCTRDEAIEALHKAAGGAPRVEPEAPRRRGVRLGELLVLSGVLTETDVMNALEWGLMSQQPIGQVLVANGLVSDNLIGAAVKLQALVESEELSAVQAGECLGRFNLTSGGSIDDIIARVKQEQAAPDKAELDYQRLLILARAVSHDDIAAAIELSLRDPNVLARLLVATGFINKAEMQATLKCLEMLSEGSVTHDDAVVSLDYCLHSRPGKAMIYEDALKELGWHKPGENDADDQANVEAGHALNLLSELENELFAEHEPIELIEEPLTAVISEDGSAVAPNTMAASKFVDTLSPEDPRARDLATLMNSKMSVGLLANNNGERTDIVSDTYSRLAESYVEQGNYSEAQVIYERIVVSRLKELGTNNVKLVPDFRNLAVVLCTQGKFDKAEPFMRRAVSILEKAGADANQLELAEALSSLGNIYLRQDKYAESEPVLKRALVIYECEAPANDFHMAQALTDYARLLRRTQRNDEAEVAYHKAKEIIQAIQAGQAVPAQE